MLSWPPARVPGAVGALTSDEVQVIQGALDLANKTAESVMTPLGKASVLCRQLGFACAAPAVAWLVGWGAGAGGQRMLALLGSWASLAGSWYQRMPDCALRCCPSIPACRCSCCPARR